MKCLASPSEPNTHVCSVPSVLLRFALVPLTLDITYAPNTRYIRLFLPHPNYFIALATPPIPCKASHEYLNRPWNGAYPEIWQYIRVELVARFLRYSRWWGKRSLLRVPLYAIDCRGIWQHPFREQSREREGVPRLATSAPCHLSRRNASAYCLCVWTATGQWHAFALTRRNQIPSAPSSGVSPGSLHHPIISLNCSVLPV